MQKTVIEYRKGLFESLRCTCMGGRDVQAHPPTSIFYRLRLRFDSHVPCGKQGRQGGRWSELSFPVPSRRRGSRLIDARARTLAMTVPRAGTPEASGTWQAETVGALLRPSPLCPLLPDAGAHRPRLIPKRRYREQQGGRGGHGIHITKYNYKIVWLSRRIPTHKPPLCS